MTPYVLAARRQLPAGLRRTSVARPPADARVLDGDVTVLDDETGAPVAVQALGGAGFSGLGARLRHVRYDESASQARLSGLQSASAVFGTIPPQALRRRYGCARALFDSREPSLRAELQRVAERALAVLRERAPAAAADTVARAAHLPGAWRLPDTPWTSGIINANAGLPYHRDSGNVPRTWSAMLGLRRACEGGFLHLADYDLWLTIPDGSLTLFDGQSILHGVSPFRFVHPSGYRFTVVFYARSGCAGCADDPAAELARAQLEATRHNLTRAAR